MNGTRNKTKKIILEKIKPGFKTKIDHDGKEKSKVQYILKGMKEWKPIDRVQYMSKLTRKQVSILFKARTRMLDVKNNFRNKYRDEFCRGCGTIPETQKNMLWKNAQGVS